VAIVQRNIDPATMTEHASASGLDRVSVTSLRAPLRNSRNHIKHSTLHEIFLAFASIIAASSLLLVRSGAKAHVSEFLAALCALAFVRLLVVVPAVRLRAR
jgi:hypothetical protein